MAGLVTVGLAAYAYPLRGAGLEPLADPYAGTNLLAQAVFLETGPGASEGALLRTNLPWVATRNLSHPALVFAFGFATDEILVPGEFFDSLTVTVRNADRSYVVPVLTADVLGLTAAPGNPDGSELRPGDVVAESLAFPALSQSFRFQQAFLILASLPAAVSGQSGTIGISLFNNQDSQASLAFVGPATMVPGPGSPLALESSAALAGPYAPEGALSVRHARRRLILPRPSAHRFYVLKADTQTRITSMREDGADWVFQYTGAAGPRAPGLLSSAQAAGPYAVEAGVVSDVAEHTLRVRQDGLMRFYRIHGEIPLTIRGVQLDGSQMTVSYEEP